MTGILESLSLRYGPTPNSDPLTIRPGSMTVLVRPNNSGKSLLLREIEHYVGAKEQHHQKRGAFFGLLSGASRSNRNWLPSGDYKVLQALTPRLPSDGELRQLFCESIHKELEELKLIDVTDSSLWKLGLLALFTGNQEVTTQTIEEKSRNMAQAQQADHWRRSFRQLVKHGHIDIDAFCQCLEIAQDSPLARILALDEADGMKALEQVLDAEDPEQVRPLIEQGLAMAQRFQRYLRDSDECAELADAGVVDLGIHRQVLAPFTVLLDGHSRLQQVEPVQLTSFYEQAGNDASALLRDQDALEALRKHVYQTFGFYLAIDILDMARARFVAADEPPDGREFSLGPDAIAYFQKATDLREKSDGVRSFVGIHAALAGRDYRLLLIDEPEAFLHPPLVRRLGFDLTRMAAEQGASIIAATHSADFLMGCVEAGHDVDVIRLGYENELATARALPSDELKTMMRDPLLRSTGVLTALFHRTAVVCEGDSDAAFYAEINERLRVQAERANADAETDTASNHPCIRDAVFINTHGKDNIPRLMGALRRVGIPAVAIVDLDLLVDKNLTPNLLKQAGVAEATYKGLGETRRSLLEKYDEQADERVPPLKKDADADAEAKQKREEQLKNERGRLIKRGGVTNLPEERDRRAVRDFLEALAGHGIFVPECGELEHWLPGVSEGMGKGKNWLRNMFERMGTPGEDSYLEPGDDDVWEFMRKIARWIEKSLNDYDWIPAAG